MPNSIYHSRIYYQTNKERRKFAWVSLGIDGSVYFGGSADNHFNTGYHGKTRCILEGRLINPKRDGKETSKEHRKSKISIHKSGIINQAQTDASGRTRAYSRPLEECEFLPLVSFLPMDPERYPISTKKLGKYDLIFVNSTQYRLKPHGVALYLRRPNAKNSFEAVAGKEPELLSSIQLTEVEFGAWYLGAMFYRNETFSYWPQLQITVHADPQEGGQIPLALAFPERKIGI